MNPVLSASRKRPYDILGTVIVYRNITVLEKSVRIRLFNKRIPHNLGKGTLAADRISRTLKSVPTSDVFVKMRYNDRDFTVYITGEKECTDGSDSYQAPDINQALFDLINDEKDGLQVLDIYPNNKTRITPVEPLYSAYFDGSNLAELL